MVTIELLIITIDIDIVIVIHITAAGNRPGRVVQPGTTVSFDISLSVTEVLVFIVGSVVPDIPCPSSCLLMKK